MIQNPYRNTEATMSQGNSPNLDDVVRRPELEQILEGLNREFSGFSESQKEILSRLDKVLEGRVAEARQMGGLQEQVRRQGEDIGKLSLTVQAMQLEANRNQIAPRDAALKYLFELIKLAVAAGIGYLLSGGRHPL